MREEILAINTPTHTLAATLVHAKPAQTKALILMFAGSGPIDRNENLPNFSLNIFNKLAESFADAGYASVRYDKRGCGASGGDYISAGHSDFVADAVWVTNHMQQLTNFANTPLILLGHSEGAAIAPQVAAQLTPPVHAHGLILLCPFSRPRINSLVRATARWKRRDAKKVLKTHGKLYIGYCYTRKNNVECKVVPRDVGTRYSRCFKKHHNAYLCVGRR